jgi:uncharacterized cysteine cluster protein YcgN (CxxCxxCC family)
MMNIDKFIKQLVSAQKALAKLDGKLTQSLSDGCGQAAIESS